MPTIIHIHGGEARNNDEEFVTHLRNTDLDLSRSDQKKRSRRYDEIFPDMKSHRPQMPCGRNAKYPHWKIRFEKYLEQLSGELILIGHSLGANFLAKRLAENHTADFDCTVIQLHLVAGCFGIAGGFDLADNFPGYLSDQAADIHIYHSTDDDLVPFSDAEQYATSLPQATLHTFTDRWHFIQPDFPELRAEIHCIL